MAKKHVNVRDILKGSSAVMFDVFDCSNPDFFTNNYEISSDSEGYLYSGTFSVAKKIN